MKATSIFTKFSVSLVALLSSAVLTAGVAHAIPYTGPTTQPSPVPAFNVYTPTPGNSLPAPAPSDGENDFFQGRVPANGDLNDGTTPFTDPVSTNCTNGEILQMHIYVHNGASQYDNNNGTGPSVAHGTMVKVGLPTTTASSFDPTATISATNAATVSDGLNISCANGAQVSLQYIKGSASQFSNGSGVLGLSDAIVDGGVPIQSEKVAGDVWGCWNERVYVVLAVKVVVTPPTPTPPVLQCTLNLFTVDQADRKVTVGVQANVQNATVTGYSINWGDNSSSNKQSDTHTYASTVNNATIQASFTATANGQTYTEGGQNCMRQVSFTPGTPPVTPPQTPPTVLPNTGAGSIAGIFTGVTIAGAAGYRWLLGRRLSR
ncbi:MAG TPA: hypothetical protein VFN56_00960 [Candidatus Saccharimonadales bacterium]|nr:hypothetical protein [Candidatus Saccharimonadales bacterium]